MTLLQQLPDVLQIIGQDIKVLVQDTGWRKMTHEKLADGYVAIRRIGNMVFLNIRGGVWDTFKLRDMVRDQREGNREGWRCDLFQLPDGFRPDVPQGVSLYKDFYKEIGVCMVSSISDGNAILQLRNKTIPELEDNKDLRIQEMKFLTSDPFPKVLPGSQV